MDICLHNLHWCSQQCALQGYPDWTPWAPPQLGENSNILPTTLPPPTPRTWALLRLCHLPLHYTQCWTCHCQAPMEKGYMGMYLRVSTLYAVKLSSHICNCLIGNVKKCPACPVITMVKHEHISWEPNKKTEKEKHTPYILWDKQKPNK